MNKRTLFLAPIVALVLSVISFTAAATCTTIQDGVLVTSGGDPITTGYDEWGYNYQARSFNGDFCTTNRNSVGCPSGIDLMMKWNDAWLSNKDCSGDGQLDRHLGYPSYIDSGAWLTNHMSGKVEVNGKNRRWTYFVKIVAVTSDAEDGGDGFWYTSSGTQIGKKIWGEFAIIQEILNDPSSGAHGVLYNSPFGPGFGKFSE